ncbi:MAG: AsnC family transcriptional regulator [Actinobacteria bacterium]|nr:AsnC family transcriptional regulator [Actinomycetota bacterium]
MDNIDRKLLNLIQDNFPVDSRPYLKLARRLGISEKDVISKINYFKKKGIIRRLGVIFDSKKLGYESTLCAIKVPKSNINEVAEIINSIPDVTHNYLRKHKYNMWFTLIAPDNEAINRIFMEIRRDTGIEDIINLPAVKVFKINAIFNVNEV